MADFSSARTRHAIRTAWEQIRPQSKNDRSAIRKVTLLINRRHLTLRPISATHVTHLTVAMKLRPPFSHGLRTPRGTSAAIQNGLPSLDELVRVVQIVKQIDQLTATSKALIRRHLTEKAI